MRKNQSPKARAKKNQTAPLWRRRRFDRRQALHLSRTRSNPAIDPGACRQAWWAGRFRLGEPDPDRSQGLPTHDGTAISFARLAGIKTGLITKRVSETVGLRARDLKLNYVCQGIQDKLTAFEEILRQGGLNASEAAFVGDDIIDLPVMRSCGLAIAVANARAEVKADAHYVTPHAEGMAPCAMRPNTFWKRKENGDK
jgi:YrbI family 3-deoxy-D-manno-octulosonate 8-phosphate phosphatase